MTEWARICSILGKASASGCAATIPQDIVTDFYMDVLDIARKKQGKALKKVYTHLQKKVSKSFWIVVSPASSCITLRLRGAFRNKDLRRMYNYVNKYYQYTDDMTTDGDNLELCLLVDGCYVTVRFDSYGHQEVTDSYRERVQIWAESHNVGRAIRSDSDIIVWCLLHDTLFVEEPFMIGLSDKLL